VGAVKNITIISIVSAAVLGVFKKFTMEQNCFGIKVKRKNFWQMKQKSIGSLLKSLLNQFKTKRKTRYKWKKMFQLTW